MMTRLSTRKTVPDGHWQGRLREAEDYLDAAKRLLGVSGESDNANPVLSLIAISAIGFCDALTASRGGVVNRQDHQAAPKLLRDVFGSSLPDEQERNFRRLVEKKDDIQYGIRGSQMQVAHQRIEYLESFGQWASDVLVVRPPMNGR